jgi:hypothetical protein
VGHVPGGFGRGKQVDDLGELNSGQGEAAVEAT